MDLEGDQLRTTAGDSADPPAEQGSGDPTTGDEMAEDVVDLLNEDPTKKEPTPFKFHNQLTSRWNYTLKYGSKKEERAKLLEKYPRVGNCILDALALNEEVEALLTDPGKQRDRYYASFQKSAGSALVGVGTAVSMILAKSEEPLDRRKLFTLLYDSGSILTTLHNTLTLARREMVFAAVQNKESKAILTKSEPAEGLLFGPGVKQKFDNNTTIKKFVASLKATQTPPKKPGTGNQQTPQGHQGSNRAGRSQRRPFNPKPYNNNSYSGNNNRSGSRPKQQQQQKTAASTSK